MKYLFCILFLLFSSIKHYAQDFSDYFQNKTLRIDYLFTGNAKQQFIVLDELSQLPTWAGRRQHLAELPLEGNGQIIVRDLITKKCIYKTSFSSLFQPCWWYRLRLREHQNCCSQAAELIMQWCLL